ncbi:MAG: hypothetical protein Kow0025_23930 [Thermodesulfovibrionales bacterium]
MLFNNIYYSVKPLIPRRLQIFARRKMVARKLRQSRDVWPIDERAAAAPEGWKGWPGGKKFALVLTHDVETIQGLAKCRHLAEMEKGRGFRSSFNFVPEGYDVPRGLRQYLVENGFEVGVHGLKHDGKLFVSEKRFLEQAVRINRYLREWRCVGFSSPSMHHNLEWTHALDIEYDSSTFDTDPFEPQPDGVTTIFPFLVRGRDGRRGYVELPYTLPQDFTLFVLVRERDTGIWKAKLDWIADRGGMALLIAHPDYMNYRGGECRMEEYPARLYEELLDYIEDRHGGLYWNALPREVARFWVESNGGRAAWEAAHEPRLARPGRCTRAPGQGNGRRAPASPPEAAPAEAQGPDGRRRLP